MFGIKNNRGQVCSVRGIQRDRTSGEREPVADVRGSGFDIFQVAEDAYDGQSSSSSSSCDCRLKHLLGVFTNTVVKQDKYEKPENISLSIR